MKFTRKNTVTNLKEGRNYKGTIFDIQHIELKKRSYYEITLSLEKSLVSIWVNDDVNPEHPLYELFDFLIENEEDAEDFDEREIIGYQLQFTVKNVLTKGKNGDVERSFFDTVTVVFDEEE